MRWGDKGDSDTRSAAQAACAPPPSSTCQDTKANNYGAPLPCTYQPPPPPGSTGGSGPTPPPGTGYPGQYYVPPYSQPGVIGHWQCVTYNADTPYEIQNCTWTTTGYYYDRLASRPMSLSRIAAPDAAARSQSSADLPSVFVIVSDQVPSDAIAVIERHKTGPLKNVLLVPLKHHPTSGLRRRDAGALRLTRQGWRRAGPRASPSRSAARFRIRTSRPRPATMAPPSPRRSPRRRRATLPDTGPAHRGVQARLEEVTPSANSEHG